MCETALTRRPPWAHSPSMISSTLSVQSSASTSRRVSHRTSSPNRRTNSLHAYDARIEAWQRLRLPLPAAGGQTTRILIVDDACTTGSLVYLLQSLGCWATRSASSGATALNLAQDFSPSIVLISLQLPGMNAYRVAAQLRNQAGERHTRIIALTTEPLHTDTGRDLARQAGFERYLAKPVGVVALQQLLRPQLP